MKTIHNNNPMGVWGTINNNITRGCGGTINNKHSRGCGGRMPPPSTAEKRFKGITYA
jgi:hypothetical protein